MHQWLEGEAGAVRLPSGRTVLGRSLSRQQHDNTADLTLVLASRPPPPPHDPRTWIAWPDFGLPRDRTLAARLLHEAWARSERERVLIACRGGRGRTGTALACIAVLDGMPPPAAIAHIRHSYHCRAIETPWQKRYVATFAAAHSAV